MNVSFVRIDDSAGVIEYRCYERGINRETLACGTGALAVAYISKVLERVSGDKITLRPHRCNWYQPEARLWVEASAEGWLLMGNPMPLFSGEFPYLKVLPEYAPEYNESTAAPIFLPNLSALRPTYNEPISVF